MVWQRIEVDNRSPRRMLKIDRQLISGKRLSRQWIYRGARTLGEVAGSFESRGNVCYERYSFAEPRAIIISEEEGFIFANWPTQRKPKLISLVPWRGFIRRR